MCVQQASTSSDQTAVIAPCAKWTDLWLSDPDSERISTGREKRLLLTTNEE